MKNLRILTIVLLFWLPTMGQAPVTQGVYHAWVEGDRGLPAPSGYVLINGPERIPGTTPRVCYQAMRRILSGRMYAEVQAPATVGVAFSNPNPQTITLSFHCTDSNGLDVGFGTTTIGPNSQIARFLHESPFNAPVGLVGAFTFSASAPIAAVAVRGLVNDEGVFLMPQVPVLEITDTGTTVVPYFADGVPVWSASDRTTTEVVLVNMTDQPLSGTFTFMGQGNATSEAQRVDVTIDGQAGATFPYAIPSRSSRRFATQERSEPIRTGTIRVAPAGGSATPAAFAIVSSKRGTTTRDQQTVPGQRPGAAFRVPVFGQVVRTLYLYSTRIVIANPSPTSVSVDLDMNSPARHATVILPGNGQIETFPDIAFNLGSLEGYSGALRISSVSPISVIAFQNFPNADFEFACEAFDESVPAFPQAVIPQIVTGLGGYTTSLGLLKTSNAQASSWVVRFFSQTGDPLGLTMWNAAP